LTLRTSGGNDYELIIIHLTIWGSVE
jgi:hypothetical protein